MIYSDMQEEGKRREIRKNGCKNSLYATIAANLLTGRTLRSGSMPDPVRSAVTTYFSAVVPAGMHLPLPAAEPELK